MLSTRPPLQDGCHERVVTVKFVNMAVPATGGATVAAVGGPSRSPTRAMGGPDVAAAGDPSSRSPTRAIGGPGVAAVGGPSRSPRRSMGGPDVAAAGGPGSRSPTQSRTTRDGNLGDDYDEGDSIWLPPLTGAQLQQFLSIVRFLLWGRIR